MGYDRMGSDRTGYVRLHYPTSRYYPVSHKVTLDNLRPEKALSKYARLNQTRQDQEKTRLD